MAYTDICGKKLRSKLGASLNESASSHSPALLPSSQSFAKRQLEKMGWTEGTGLGRRRDGMKDHVKIKQREDEMGLGREGEKVREAADVWWKDSLGGTLARLQSKKKKKTGKRKGDRKKSRKEESPSTSAARTFTDDELFAATGGARFGMRAQRRAEGKWQRTEPGGSGLAELEARAQAGMEWDGRGSAKVFFEGTLSGKRRRSEEDANVVSPSMSEEDCNVENHKEKRVKKKKKRFKKERVGRKSGESAVGAVSLPVSEEEHDAAVGRKEEKRSKKEIRKQKRRELGGGEVVAVAEGDNDEEEGVPPPPSADEEERNKKEEEKRSKKKKDKRKKSKKKKSGGEVGR